MTRLDPMPVVLELDYFDHHKTEQVGAHGRELHLRSIAHANRFWTDGFVPHAKAISLAKLSLTVPGSIVEPSVTEALSLIDSLVDAGLFDHADGGFDIHDYAVYQETRVSIERKRERWRRQKRSQRGMSASCPPDVRPSVQKALDPERVDVGQSDLTATHKTSNGSGPVTWQNAHEHLTGTDELTPAVFKSIGRHFGFAEAPLADAMAALQARRAKTPPLVSEVRYVVSVLKDARDSGRYGSVASA